MRRARFSHLLSKKQFIFVVGFFFIVLFILYKLFFSPINSGMASLQKFEIKRGESLNTVIDNLYERGIIPDKFRMKIVSFIYGAEKKIRAARYEISGELNYLELVELFLYGKADFLRRVKIFPGSTIKTAAATLRLDALIDSAGFVETANRKSFIDSLGIKAASLEGYLLPGEYFVYEKSDPVEVIKMIYESFKEFAADTLKYNQLNSKYSLHELVTLASIVEGETNKISEMPTIAGVYLNRLNIGMKLQADPTIQYLQADGWKRLSYKDLKIDSPYNTYKYSGLPPGPINNPGRDALFAAVNPEKHSYLFFVADGDGGHKFAKTYSQHLAFVKDYRKWLAAQKDS